MTKITPSADRIVGAVVAVTGTSRGIGRATALALAQAGANVVCHARTQAAAEAAAEAARACASNQFGGAGGAGGAVGVAGDLAEADLGARVVAAAEDTFGRLDAAVLSAAILGRMGPLVETPDQLFARVMELDVTAQFRLAKALIPAFQRAGGGVLVWLSSGLGRFGLPRFGAYAAAKHAVEGLAKVVAEEHRADGIVSVPVAPGMVSTDMLGEVLGGADTSSYRDPAEVGAAFVRLIRRLRGPEGLASSGQSLDV